MNILIPDTIFDDDHAIEEAAASPCSLTIREARSPGDLPRADWENAEAIVAHHLMPYSTEIADRAKNVRILVRVGVGVDNIDLPVWARRCIPVCNVPDYGTGEVADHALALILSLLRGLTDYQNRVGNLVDDVFDRLPLPKTMRRAAGLNCLVIGYGAIGRELVSRVSALGMNTGVFTRGAQGGSVRTGSVTFNEIEKALAWADIVSLHLPLTAETENLIDEKRLAIMKPDALLINTARGGLVDTNAAATALKNGELGGLGLDVFPEEPLPSTDPLVVGLRDNEDWASGRIVLTPHVGGASPQALEELRRRSVETARDFLVGGTIVNRVA